MLCDDPYVYKNSSVLKNKLGLTDGDRLDQAEARHASIRAVYLRKKGLEIKSVFDIKEIHKTLFEELFDWAGEFRIITMYKKEPI